MENVRVDLLQKPEDALRLIYTACRTCYSPESANRIWKSPTECINQDEDDTDCHKCDEGNWCSGYAINREKMLKLVEKVMQSGHHSTLEHCQFVFAVKGITRKTSHQLVRHRHMSFSQKSQRYVTYHKPFTYNIPQSIVDHKFKSDRTFSEYCDERYVDTMEDYYEWLMRKIQEFYNIAIEEGIPAEDARDVFPNACHTDMVVSLNLRELIHLANLRLCTNAQKEIRVAVQEMCNLVIKQEPWLAKYLTPKCYSLGYCNEIKCCGRKPKKG